MKTVKIALLGLGTVGTGLWSLLQTNRDEIEASTGAQIELAAILVRDKEKDRGITVPQDVLTTEVDDLMNDPEIRIVVELIGGIEPAREYVLRALTSGKHVVTANKALIAQHGAELHAVAEAHGVLLRYEASVGGGIPIITILQDYLAAEKITTITGIVNGTTNYILTRMSSAGSAYEEALTEAQAAGYAEADPSSDVEGFDALYKLKIMANLAYGVDIPEAEIYREGITGITPADIRYAQANGYVIKLLAVSRALADTLELRVAPALLPVDHRLAKIDDSFNAVVVHGSATGELSFIGRGAGGLPTGSAVLADIISVLRIEGAPIYLRGRSASEPLTVADARSLPSAWYIRLELLSGQGLSERVGHCLAEHGVDVVTLDRCTSAAGLQTLQIRTASVSERAIRQALSACEEFTHLIKDVQLIRIEQ